MRNPLFLCAKQQLLLISIATILARCVKVNGSPTNENWDLQFGVPGASDQVTALLVVGTDLYAVGGFSNIGGIAASRVARFDGSMWHPLGNGLSSSTFLTVRALAFVHGLVYAGGSFTQAGSVSVNNIAKWNGTNWSPCGSGIGGPGVGIVRSMVAYQGDLVVAGSFVTAGGASVTNIARWDGTHWASVGGGISGTLNCPSSKMASVWSPTPFPLATSSTASGASNPPNASPLR